MSDPAGNIKDFEERVYQHLIEYMENNQDLFTKEENERWKKYYQETVFPDISSTPEMISPSGSKCNPNISQ
jgi:hypothetical protein